MSNLYLEYRLIILALSLVIINQCDTQIKNVEEKQNILFIAVDDLNDWAGFLSGHAGMKIHTPNIDRLAASSMIFTTLSDSFLRERKFMVRMIWAAAPKSVTV